MYADSKIHIYLMISQTIGVFNNQKKNIVRAAETCPKIILEQTYDSGQPSNFTLIPYSEINIEPIIAQR